MNPPASDFLREVLAQMRKASTWFRASVDACRPLVAQEELTDRDWERLEALTSRFARLCDLIVHKVFRALDRFELEPPGTLLDVMNRAERRGLIATVDEIRAMKDLRNDIAHEYVEAALRGLSGEVLESAPRLLEISARTDEYASRLLASE